MTQTPQYADGSVIGIDSSTNGDNSGDTGVLYSDNYSDGISAGDSAFENLDDSDRDAHLAGMEDKQMMSSHDDKQNENIHGLQNLIERYQTQLAELEALKNNLIERYQTQLAELETLKNIFQKRIITSSSLSTTGTDWESWDRLLPIHGSIMNNNDEDGGGSKLKSESKIGNKICNVYNEEVYSDNIKDEEKHNVERTSLPSDTFSFIAVCHPCSMPFFIAFKVAAFQIATFSLVASNVLTLDNTNNPLNIPTNVAAEVRVTQFIAIIIAVMSQTDIRTSLNLCIQGFGKESILEAFPNFTATKFLLSIIMRLLQGALGLFVTFLLIVTEETVVDLLLNFTAMEFVSQLDELCFFMSQEGFFGKPNSETSKAISEKTYITCEAYQRTRGRTYTKIRFLLLAVFFIVMLTSWFIVAKDQSSGKFLCSTIYVQFSDEFLPTLGSFSGLYDRRIKQTGIFAQEYVEYVDRHSGLAAFGYCKHLEAWTFRYGEKQTDPCDWVARSTETATFDITQMASTEWSVQNSLYREINLEHFYLSCYDCDDYSCGGRGICHDAVCSCNDGWYGLQCEFEEPCPTLEFDERFGPFRGSHKWSTKFDRFEVNNTFVDVYHRPVYVNEYNPGQFEIIVFFGRRYAATASPLMREVSKNGKTTKEALANYFMEDFHPGLSSFAAAFTSTPMDVGTATDNLSPIALQWFSLTNMHMNSSTVDLDLRNGMTVHDNVLLCKKCSESNPCLYDGECINSTCQCAIGASGSICQVTPIGNGHCDSFYNTLEFSFDGGDCCESTCVSTQNFTCGTDKSGFVNRGYFFCHQPREGWRPNGDLMEGDAASLFGFNAILSNNGKFLVVSEPGMSTVKFFDKVGSKWVQRGRTIQGRTELGFGTSVAMSSGPMDMVNNPLSTVPSMAVIGSSWTIIAYVSVYECSNHGCSQVGFDLFPFERVDALEQEELVLSVVVDISNDGGVVVAGARPFPSKDSLPNLETFPLAVFDRDLSVGWKQRKMDLLLDEKETVFSVALSGSGNILAVTFCKVGFSTDRGSFIENGNTRVYSWNGTFWNQRGSTIVGDTLHRALVYQVQGKNLDLSDDGNVLAIGAWMNDIDRSVVRILRWDEYKSDWIQQGSFLTCGDFELQGLAVSLAFHGLTVAIGSADYSGVDSWGTSVGMNGTACVFRWNGIEWEKLGVGVPGGHMGSVVLSGDGFSLAVGLPFATFDNTGLVTVYELPRETCANDKSLFRISLTTGGDTTATTWDLFSNKTGERILSGGPYGDNKSFFISMVNEICVLTDDCLIFTIYDNLDLNKPMVFDGVEPPGGHVLFLDGEEIVSSRLQDAVERVVVGNTCMKCPASTGQFRMMIHTCEPVAWNLIDRSGGETLFSKNNFVEYSDRLNNNCSFGNQTTYWEELCLSLDDDCYIFSVFAQQFFGVRGSAMGDAVSEDNTTRTSIPNLQYRLFFNEEQIATNVTYTLPTQTNYEPVASVSVGNCER